eukprot:Sdes_comp20378_c1_seq1m14244
MNFHSCVLVNNHALNEKKSKAKSFQPLVQPIRTPKLPETGSHGFQFPRKATSELIEYLQKASSSSAHEISTLDSFFSQLDFFSHHSFSFSLLSSCKTLHSFHRCSLSSQNHRHPHQQLPHDSFKQCFVIRAPCLLADTGEIICSLLSNCFNFSRVFSTKFLFSSKKIMSFQRKSHPHLFASPSLEIRGISTT